MNATNQKQAKSLRSKAAVLRKKIEGMLEPRLENTPKRRREGEERRKEAYTLMTVAGALESLADLWSMDAIDEELKPIKTADHVRYLLEYDNPRGFRLTFNNLRVLLDNYSHLLHPEDLRAITDNYNLMEIGKNPDIIFRPSTAMASRLVNLVSKNPEMKEAFHPSAVEGTKLSLSLGVFEYADFAKVKTLLHQAINLETMEALKRLRRIMDAQELLNKITNSKPDGYWPTPDHIAEELAEMLDIEPKHQVLEPSAGTGNLVKAAVRKGAFVTAFEVVGAMCEYMRMTLPGSVTVIHDDFLTSWPPKDAYDRVFMNPPFENRKDGEHVTHAYEILRDGGRLLAIVSAGIINGNDKKAIAFQTFLKEKNARVEKRDDIFHIPVYIVMIDKPR